MAGESLPAIDFWVVYPAGALAHDAGAAAFVSEVWAAEVGAGQRGAASLAEAIAGDGSAAAGIAGGGSGRRGYSSDGREAAASGNVAGVRAARIFPAGECGDGASAGSGRMRGGQPGGAAVLWGATGPRGRGRGRGGAGSALD